MNYKKMNNLKLTIFTTFKPFSGHSKIIQINAIKSWLLLVPKPEIFIFGNATGSKEIADEFNLRHFPHLKCSPSGSPYANMMFEIVETMSKNSIFAYLNGDIILNNSMMYAVEQAVQKFSKFLMVGCRWDLDISEYIDYTNHNWQNDILDILKHKGKLHGPTGIDYFVFTRRLWPVIPPFIVGRAHWDNGLMALSSFLDIPIIDATAQVLAVHQNHDYSHMVGGKDEVWNGKDAHHNLKIAGGFEKLRNISHARLRLNKDGIQNVEELKRKRIQSNKIIKLLQVQTFYLEYINNHYQKFPNLQNQSYEKQIQSLINDGFSSGSIVTPFLNKDAYSSELIIANNLYSQSKWILENKDILPNYKNWCAEVLVAHQIEIIKPDILYISNPVFFNHAFWNCLKWKPKLLIGWRASIFDKNTCLHGYDILLSHLQYCKKEAILRGARSVEYLLPGFSKRIIKHIRRDEKKWDFIFTGNATGLHKRRNKYLIDVARYFSSLDSIQFAFYMSSNNVLPGDLPINKLSPLWGIDMYQEIQKSKIVLNADIDIAHEAGNFRVFEVTGVGSFLLTEYHPNIEQIFKPGIEIETFRDSNELIAKIKYYLAHPDEREAIARRGQERCLKDHLMENRVKRLENIIIEYAKKNGAARDS